MKRPTQVFSVRTTTSLFIVHYNKKSDKMNYYQISKQLKVFTMISDQLWQTTTTANSPKGCELHKATCSDLSRLRARDRTKPRKQHYCTAAHCYNSRRLNSNPSFSCHRREKPKYIRRKSKRNNDQLCFDPPRLKTMDEN